MCLGCADVTNPWAISTPPAPDPIDDDQVKYHNPAREFQGKRFEQIDRTPIAPAPIPAYQPDLLAPHPPTSSSLPAISRIRSNTVSSISSTPPSLDTDAEDSGASSDDSVLSWWSSDDEGDSEDEAKEADKRRREEVRQKILDTAGLILKREPALGVSSSKQSGIGIQGKARRPAPAAPASLSQKGLKVRKSRRKAPGVPLGKAGRRVDGESGFTSDVEGGGERKPGAEVQDAYAKYEQYLHQAQAKSTKRRSRSGTTSQRPTSATSDLAVSTSPTPTQSSTLGSSVGGGGGGKITGFFSRMMAPSGSSDSASGAGAGAGGRKIISGPIIRRTDEDGMDIEGGEEESGIGKTWSSLVEPSVLETMSTRERKRQEVSQIPLELELVKSS